MPILQLTFVAILACAGYWLGVTLNKRRPAAWWTGFGVFLGSILVVAMGRRFIELSFIPPFSWVTAASTNYLVMALLSTGIFAMLCPKLTRPRERHMVSTLMILFVLFYSVLPIVMPVVVRADLAETPMRMDKDRVCRQTHDYTCGPAAAVTALDRLGVSATEAQLAIDAQTWPGGGTDPQRLVNAMNDLLADRGMTASYAMVPSLADLGQALPAIVIIKGGPLNDHYVTVLSIDDKSLVIGDPWSGKLKLSIAKFNRLWRSSAITFRHA